MTGRIRHSAGRTLATVLFTDIVGSTERQRALGDGAWRRLREEFERETHRHVEQFDGRTLHFTGDGAVAAFPLPSDALRAARRLVEAAERQGIQIRAGLHSGEVDRHGDDLSGICVNIAARVAALASDGEILATTTVRDLVEGSGLHFSEAGVAELKGVGTRSLVRLAVASSLHVERSRRSDADGRRVRLRTQRAGYRRSSSTDSTVRLLSRTSAAAV